MKKMKELLNEIRFRDDTGNIMRLSDITKEYEDKFLKYMVKSKYRNKPKSKDLKDMFDTYISGDKDMEKKYRKIR